MKYLKILYLCYAVILFLSAYEWLLPRLAALKPLAGFNSPERGNGAAGPARDSRGP